MKKHLLDFEISDWAGICTWAVIASLTMYFMYENTRLQGAIPIVALLLLIYLCCFLMATRDSSAGISLAVRQILLICMLATTYAVLWFIPAAYLSILTIIWVAVLVHFVSVRATLVITVLVIVTWFGLFSIKWTTQNIWFSAMLYGSFHFFSILMAYQTQQAQHARERTERLNIELSASRDLIEQASRQRERTRIARDLHDLIGHHLTALIINLEVAKHQTTGAAREQVEQSHALAKLLLSDVREAISEIRANESININSLIELWRSYIPNLAITTEIDDTIQWHDLTITQTVSFCILEALTNSMRHANASRLTIKIQQQGEGITIIIDDDGHVKEPIRFGNGLTGMQERLSAINGSLQTMIVDGHLQLSIEVPQEIHHEY